MDYSLENPLQYFPDAEKVKGMYGNKYMDYANIGDFDANMPINKEAVQQCSGLGMNPFQIEMNGFEGMANANQMPTNPSLGMANMAPQSMSAMNGLSLQNLPSPRLGTVSQSSFNNLPNDRVSQSLPSKNAISEICTTNQPMNASLRNSYSGGNYYFLK